MSHKGQRRRGLSQGHHDAAEGHCEHSTVDVAELEARITANVLGRIALALAGPTKPSHYSRRRGCAPPGRSDRNWKAIARTVPGASKPGRWWIVPVSDYEAWERSQSRRAPPAVTANDHGPSTWTPAQAMAELGLRGTRS
jgi:hypothetical protein